MVFRNVDIGDYGRKLKERNFVRNGMIFILSKDCLYICGIGNKWPTGVPSLVIKPNALVV
jgi:hypothetical protein